MSSEEESSIFLEMKLLRKLAYWILGVMATCLCAGVVVGINDHFALMTLVRNQEAMQKSIDSIAPIQTDVAVLKSNLQEIKPRVERMWWKGGWEG